MGDFADDVSRQKASDNQSNDADGIHSKLRHILQCENKCKDEQDDDIGQQSQSDANTGSFYVEMPLPAQFRTFCLFPHNNHLFNNQYNLIL